MADIPVVYTLTVCPACDRLRDSWRKQGIKYEERRVDQAQETLDEALMLGHEYGTGMADRAVSLKDTTEAFIFFRTMVLDSANAKSWSQALEVADRVLVGIVESYQARLSQANG